MCIRDRYEDVLIVRVEQLVPQDVWEARYDQINACLLYTSRCV